YTARPDLTEKELTERGGPERKLSDRQSREMALIIQLRIQLTPAPTVSGTEPFSPKLIVPDERSACVRPSPSAAIEEHLLFETDRNGEISAQGSEGAAGSFQQHIGMGAWDTEGATLGSW
ncbi:hypothetical protein chiPu_0030169, partial [Chiloscyllium punctatum]|nr:hypothetical protein [Chiloscyllium punctatum]